jgi:HprK-related kinase A
MKLGDCSVSELHKQTSSNRGTKLDVGPFTIRLRSNNKNFIKTFRDLYLDFQVSEKQSFVDFHIDILPPASLRRWIKPQVIFNLDGHKPFTPASPDYAMPLFEWGFNWCIARHAQHFLMLHAAVLEKNGNCLILPAMPGSGKSTLAAALSHRGWRFLSDEFCLIRPSDSKIIPIPRPTPLKNESIQIIRDFSPDAFIGPLFPKTRKGTIGHLRSPAASVNRQRELGTAKWIIFPKYQASLDVSLSLLNKSLALFKIATNSFNYEIQGEKGFKLVAEMTRSCDCYSLKYGNLDDVIDRLNQLANDV